MHGQAEAGLPALHGVMAEYETLDGLIAAVGLVRERGYRNMDAYSPVPSEALAEALHLPHSPLPWFVLGAGLTGAAVGYGLQYWVHVLEYPLNIGGRPLNSWPYFIPVAFETTVLFSVLTTVLGLFALVNLPQHYHPVFHVERFARASVDRFFLCVEATDPTFDRDALVTLLESTEASHVADVPR